MKTILGLILGVTLVAIPLAYAESKLEKRDNKIFEITTTEHEIDLEALEKHIIWLEERKQDTISEYDANITIIQEKIDAIKKLK